ncbi:MAG: type II toxin-antitoxin system prevent-host-death family antitoxin [Anaerolineales bacterium]|uniref:Antitoxin n=1 Tax=Candidatus Desulfolinea nitratireducens TaxID=2841698 RepID=A0A8J6TIF6_9CHLR|nr:type II toxin-antitoxin system prevent-host-death family antitoxin [Candidatus Desulfolinea nitratireducens]
MFPTKIKSGEARAKWRDILDQVFAGKDMLIERNGKEIAVMIPAVDYEQIRETLEEMRATREAAAAYKEWKTDPSLARAWDNVDAELNSEE